MNAALCWIESDDATTSIQGTVAGWQEIGNPSDTEHVKKPEKEDIRLELKKKSLRVARSLGGGSAQESTSGKLEVSAALNSSIEKSLRLVQLGDNWDSEGSPGYSFATWSRAVAFLIRNAQRLWQVHSVWVNPPAILPGPDGSIDLHWRTPLKEMLVNVPANSNEPIAYYGDDYSSNSIKGEIDTLAENGWLILHWLIR